MKFDDKWSIIPVVSHFTEDAGYEEIFDDFSEFYKRYHGESYEFGFIVIDNETHLIPDYPYSFADWYNTIEDALNDCFAWKKCLACKHRI